MSRERLQKLLAAAGLGSRRHCEALIRAGRVTVDGETAVLGDGADPERDVVAVDGEPVTREPLRYWLLHKPRGVVTTRRDPHARRTVLDLLPPAAREVRLFPVGRLDRDSEGLLLLTNDGGLAQALLHPSRGSEREYRVTAAGRISRATLARLAAGVELEDGVTAPARVGAARYDPATRCTRFSLTLVEGRKRQIRRSLEALGHPVRKLLRVRMGPLRLGRLAAGAARPLNAAEKRALRRTRDRRTPPGPSRADRPGK